MSKAVLPELCCACKKLKMPHLGRFRHHGNGRRSWICANCDDSPIFTRGPRAKKHRPSPAERAAFPIFCDCGHRFIQEYKLGSFHYDFGIPKLRMLIEIDSKAYHSRRKQKFKDSLKDQMAAKEGWHLVRVKWPGDLGGSISKAVCDREAELGLER